MTNIILFLIMYLMIPPGIFILTKLLKDRLKYVMFGRRKSSTAIRTTVQKDGINKEISKRLKFTIKDPRNTPIPFRLIFLAIYISGLLVAAFSGWQSSGKLFGISILIAYISMLFSLVSANKIVVEREQVLKRMLELKGSKMRLRDREKGMIPRIEREFKITEWHEDLINPIKMEIYMPTDFDLLSVDGFLESFNLIFGANGQWVSDDNSGGFDFNAGIASIRVSPKLPQIAMWHERYLDPRYIHWSYFPLALGSENGVPLVNEETGETERVLGFAVNSGQEKLSKKNGVNIGPEIVAAPQVLVAGGTGGGKSLESTTVVNVVVSEE